jgi:hypothetical protein
MLGQSCDEDVQEELDILQGFKWANNSCAYDALFTTLWVIYSTGYPRVREDIKSNLQVLGEAFDGMINHTMSRADANRQIRDNYYKNDHVNDFSRGLYQGVCTILDHLLGQCVMSLVSSDDIDCFQFKYIRYSRCSSLSCVLKSDECLNRVQSFNGEVDTFESVSVMIEQHYKPDNRSYRCMLCDIAMDITNVVVSLPLIVCICFTGELVGCEFERNIVINDVQYELSSVIYGDGSHFKSRLNVSGSAYAYDGMISSGKFKAIGQTDFFPGTVYHTTGDIVMTANSVFYIRKM